MAKLSAWLVTLVGVLLVLLLVLPAIGVDTASLGTATSGIMGWLIALSVLVIGIGKLVRNYKK